VSDIVVPFQSFRPVANETVKLTALVRAQKIHMPVLFFWNAQPSRSRRFAQRSQLNFHGQVRSRFIFSNIFCVRPAKFCVNESVSRLFVVPVRACGSRARGDHISANFNCSRRALKKAPANKTLRYFLATRTVRSPRIVFNSAETRSPCDQPETVSSLAINCRSPARVHRVPSWPTGRFFSSHSRPTARAERGRSGMCRNAFGAQLSAQKDQDRNCHAGATTVPTTRIKRKGREQSPDAAKSGEWQGPDAGQQGCLPILRGNGGARRATIARASIRLPMRRSAPREFKPAGRCQQQGPKRRQIPGTSPVGPPQKAAKGQRQGGQKTARLTRSNLRGSRARKTNVKGAPFGCRRRGKCQPLSGCILPAKTAAGTIQKKTPGNRAT